MFTACELAAMRACVTDTLPDTAAISRNTPVDDGAGGQTDTWATTETVAAALFPETAPGEREEGGRPSSLTFWRVRVPHGTDLGVTDRLVAGGKTYEVVALDDGRSFAACLEARCRRLG